MLNYLMLFSLPCKSCDLRSEVIAAGCMTEHGQRRFLQSYSCDFHWYRQTILEKAHVT